MRSDYGTVLDTALEVLLGRSRSLVVAASDLAEHVVREELEGLKRMPEGENMQEYDEIVAAVNGRAPPVVCARLLERIEKRRRGSV